MCVHITPQHAFPPLNNMHGRGALFVPGPSLPGTVCGVCLLNQSPLLVTTLIPGLAKNGAEMSVHEQTSSCTVMCVQPGHGQSLLLIRHVVKEHLTGTLNLETTGDLRGLKPLKLYPKLSVRASV